MTAADQGTLLTTREREIARLVLDGLTSRSIARRLSISERTVHAHLNAIYGKTGARSRVLLAIWLMRRGAEVTAT